MKNTDNGCKKGKTSNAAMPEKKMPPGYPPKGMHETVNKPSLPPITKPSPDAQPPKSGK